MHVVGEDDDETLLRERRQQAERRRAHQVGLGGAGGRQPERGLERGALRPGQAPELAEHGPQQLVEAAEGDLDLGLDAARAQHRGALRHGGGVVQQGGLADARLAAQHEHPARAVAGLRHEPLDAPALRRAPQQHGAILGARV